MDFLKSLEDYGADVKNTLERFMGNESLYKKFLKKFIDDKNIFSLKKSVDETNYEDSLKYAHTLKGITANLGITPMYTILDKMVSDIRNNDFDSINNLYSALDEEYQEICTLINDID